MKPKDLINLNISNEIDDMAGAKAQSIKDTQEHIGKVQDNVTEIVKNLEERGRVHDQSKLAEPELTAFAVYGPKLKASTYGSDDYKKRMTEEEFQKGLTHHYENNSHHPEYYGEAGIKGMSLMDILEMMADWKAACERHDDGNFAESFEINRKRFKISDELHTIMVKTAQELGWL